MHFLLYNKKRQDNKRGGDALRDFRVIIGLVGIISIVAIELSFNLRRVSLYRL